MKATDMAQFCGQRLEQPKLALRVTTYYEQQAAQFQAEKLHSMYLGSGLRKEH